MVEMRRRFLEIRINQVVRDVVRQMVRQVVRQMATYNSELTVLGDKNDSLCPSKWINSSGIEADMRGIEAEYIHILLSWKSVCFKFRYTITSDSYVTLTYVNQIVLSFILCQVIIIG